MAGLTRMINGSIRLIPLQIGVTRIGRSTSCDFKLQSPVVSKLHAVIERNSEFCVLKNESPKGTKVNGEKIAEPLRLQNGDEIQIGGETLVFLLADQLQSVESKRDNAEDSDPSGITVPGSSDPDESIRHRATKAGRALAKHTQGRSFMAYSEKICGRISLREQSIASLTITDSVRKLSQVLRLTEVIRNDAQGNRLQSIFDSFYRFFPQTAQIVIAERVSASSHELRVSATDCRDRHQTALVCDDVIHHVAKQKECLLLVDQWREAPREKPRLSTMGRISMMCVPMQSTGGNCGVIQLIGGAPGPEFEIGDLERLAILAQLITIVIPLGSVR